MVRTRDLRDDNYFFDEDNYCLRGRKYGKILTLGDRVTIQVKRADLAKKQLDFALVEQGEKKEWKKPQRDFEKNKKVPEQKIESRHNKPQNNISEQKPSTGNRFKDEWGFDI
jgi:transcriptional accessory protein Tex/SPT6